MEDHETLCQKKSFEGVGKKDESHKSIVILKDSQVRRLENDSLFLIVCLFLDSCCLHQRVFLSKNRLLFHSRNHDSPLPGTMGNATVSLNPNLLKSDLLLT